MFENLLYSVKANSKSSLDDSNNLVVSNEGFNFGFEDVCLQETLQRVNEGKPESIKKVSAEAI